MTLRVRRLWLTAFVAVLGAGVVAAMVVRQQSVRESWDRQTADFVDQVNALGVSLEPGGVGTIHVPESVADDLSSYPGMARRTR
jgi:hypothetical protein